MEQRPGAGARARYWFDTTLARGTSALVGWLVLVCLAVVVPASAALVWTSGHAPATLSGKVAAIWHLTGETMRLGGTTGSPARVALSVLLALVALVYVSTLVGLITTGLTERLIALRRGRSKLLERGHVVVLGWSEQVFTVVGELVAAGANQRRSAVALLADRDKTAMEESLQSKVGPTGRTRLICRSGPSADPAVLALTSPATADSVIVLPPDASRSDADVVKALLALRATGRGGDVTVPVVAAVRDSGYLLAARLAAGSRGVVLESDTVTARLIAQAARRPGLSLVHRDLLDFAGDEFYPAAHPSLAGREFGEALLSYGNASAVGLIRGGVPWLNPPARTVLEPDDQLLVIAADDDTAELADCAPLVDERSVAGPRPPDTRPERLLVLGWNRRAPLVLREWGRNAPRVRWPTWWRTRTRPRCGPPATAATAATAAGTAVTGPVWPSGATPPARRPWPAWTSAPTTASSCSARSHGPASRPRSRTPARSSPCSSCATSNGAPAGNCRWSPSSPTTATGPWPRSAPEPT